MNKKAIIYSRVSTEEQKEHGFSLQDQESRLRRYCLEKGFDIAKHFQEDYSAKDFKRPQFQEMLEQLRSGKLKASLLVCVRMDRFSRNAMASLNMISELGSLGVRLKVLEGDFDLDVPENLIPYILNMVLPEVENKRRGINTKQGMRQGLREGKWMWRAPKGYDNEKLTKLIVLNDDAHFILEAFNQCAKDVYHNEEIRKSLVASGFMCSKQQFSNLLRNPFYMGKIRIEEWRDDPEEVVPGLHEAIVSEELFYQVQSVLKNRSRKVSKTTTRHPELPLRGYLTCQQCGGNLSGSGSTNRSKTKFYYYHCQKGCSERHKAELVNESFRTYLDSFQVPEEVGAMYMAIIEDLINKNGNNTNQKIKVLDDQIEKQQKRISEAEDKYFDQSIDHALFTSVKKRYEESIDSLLAQQAELSLQDTDYMKYVNYGLSLLLNLGSYYSNAEVEVKQKIVGSIFPEKVIFDGKKYRTTKVNEALSLLTLNINELGKNKKRLAGKNADQSNLAPPLGLEPRTL